MESILGRVITNPVQCLPYAGSRPELKISQLGYEVKLIPCFCHGNIALKAIQRPLHDILSKVYEIFVIAYPVYICLENYITRQKPVMPVFKKPPVILSSLWPGKVIAAFSELPDPVYVLFLEMVKIELSIRRFAQHIPVLYPLSETATRLYVKIECGIS